MSNPLDPSTSGMRAMGAAAVEAMVRYFESLSQSPIMPRTTAEEVRALFDEPAPGAGVSFDQLVEAWSERVVPLSRHNGHPRFFGYVASPGTAVAACADMLASALNANVTSWRSAPAAAEIEHVVTRWFAGMLGMPPGTRGILVSGGSMANFSGIAAARSARCPELVRNGAFGERPLRIYVSEEAHFSNAKAGAMLGIGQANVQAIPVDDAYRMNVPALEAQIESDVLAGFQPLCIVATAGTVATGAFDPIEEIAVVARRRGIWLHVDGAYGGFGVLAPSTRPLFAGVEAADSVSLDPHKWLFSAMGCGCILYRDPAAAAAAFAHHADYTRPVGLEAEEAFAFWDYGPELSRRFRALAVWFQIKHAGLDAIADAIERNNRCARYLQQLVDDAPDMEMLAPVQSSIFCFRHVPPGFSGNLDAFNERLLVELQRGGSSYLSNATLRGRFALRGCVLNYRTTERDMEILLDDVRAAARSLASHMLG